MRFLSKAYLCLMHRWYQRQSQYNQTGKVALCCIGKMENNYIREYVEYYKALGFDTIFIYDNNDVDGEHFEDVIGDYVSSGFCNIVDYRGRKMCQTQAYQDCYESHRNEYDWIAFFDCDEFLTFADGTKDIHDFLSRPEFLPFQLIHINWMVYGDNEMLDNDGRGVVERFKEPIVPFDFKGCLSFPENNHIKSFLRGNLTDILWGQGFGASHTPRVRYYACGNASGVSVEPNAPYHSFDFRKAYLRHYSTKTIGEWIRIKMHRGFPDMSDAQAKCHLNLDAFFRINKNSIGKRQFIDKILDLNR